MDDAALMSEIDRLSQSGDERGGFPKREQVAAQGPGEADPFNQLHGEKRPALVFADLVNLHDVRVLKLGDGFSLGAEAGQGRGISRRVLEHLEADHALETELA